MPHADGDCRPGAGGTYLPMVLNNWPMKLSGVQFARPICPPDLQTRASSLAAAVWFGANMTPKVDITASNDASRERQIFGIRFLEQDCMALRLRACAPGLEQRGHVVGGGHLAPTARGGQRGVAVAGGDVEHARPGAQIERLA